MLRFNNLKPCFSNKSFTISIHPMLRFNVNYSMDNNGVVCEMKCIMENDEVVFYYHFNEKDYLEKVYMSEAGSMKKIIFERSAELEKELKDYRSKINNLSDAI